MKSNKLNKEIEKQQWISLGINYRCIYHYQLQYSIQSILEGISSSVNQENPNLTFFLILEKKSFIVTQTERFKQLKNNWTNQTAFN